MIKALTGRLAAGAFARLSPGAFAGSGGRPARCLVGNDLANGDGGHADADAGADAEGLPAKTWTKPPPGGDKSCVASDYKMVGNKATWKIQCSGQMPMQGTGELTLEGADSYTGAIQATSQGTNMTIKLAGKKVGTCDNPQ